MRQGRISKGRRRLQQRKLRMLQRLSLEYQVSKNTNEVN
jgi:hypothetical protein